jgi:type I restriction enzyme S subunit
MLNNQTQVPIGFKSTPLGLIPESWEIKSVGDAFQICNNLRYPINTEIRKTIQGIYPYYGPTKIQDHINEFRVDGKYALIGEDGDHFLKWKEFPMTLLVVGKFNVNNHAHLVKGDENLTEWFYYYFNHKELTQYLTRQGAGRYKLTKESLSRIPCLIPPLKTQIAIVTLLTTWDSIITITTGLIAHKELRNKWLMQQLLTGRRRLPGFAGEWKLIHISDVSKEVSVKNKADKAIPVLSCTKYDGLVPSLEYFGRRIFSDDLTTYKVVPKNHFAYATNHIEEGSIGYQDNFEEALISPMYTVFKTDSSINDYFFYKLLKSYRCIYEYQSWMEGSIDRRGGLRWDAFSKIKVHVPSFKEQSAIVTVLQAADKETSLLKAKLDMLKEQKKGLMQVLLTGKKRLKINA